MNKDNYIFYVCVTIITVSFVAFIYNKRPYPHPEQHGCEYVEKAECKQVWVKK